MLAGVDAGVGGHKLAAPAMPTLKLWSKEGVFRSALTLSKAADIAAARVLAQPGRFKATWRQANLLPELLVSPAMSLHPANNSKFISATQHPDSLAGTDDAIGEVQALRADFAAMNFRLSELKKISDMAYSSILKIVPLLQVQAAASQPSPCEPAGSNELSDSNGAVLAELTRAIEQLDAVRRHVLVSLDRETQAIRQQSNALQHQSQEGVSFLDVQRILARLSNVEQQNIQIVQLLHEKVKQ